MKTAQDLGFSLDEVADLLRLDDGEHCAEARRLAEHKLVDVRGKLAYLARIESALSQVVHACHASEGKVSCPLIASLQGTTDLDQSAPAIQEPVTFFASRARRCDQKIHPYESTGTRMLFPAGRCLG